MKRATTCLITLLALGLLYTITGGQSGCAPGPQISEIDPSQGMEGDPVNIIGTGFGATQGDSAISWGAIPSSREEAVTAISWSDTLITINVPKGSRSGYVIVVVGGQSSNPVWFEVQECSDVDGDGYGNPANPRCEDPELDCDDTNPDVYPGALEICDGVDNQCPGDAGYGDTDEPVDGMACIPVGCFDMGDHFDEGFSYELPVHNVCISAFEMDVHEVTNAEYAECVDGGGCTAPFETSSETRPTYYGDPAYEDFPVIWVDWYKAEDYCTWAGKRLPTEAEWEYAARGGLAGKRYHWGDAISGTDANYWDSGDPWDNDTSQVEYYAPNGYGLYDMAGNVWEWTNDWYDSVYYQYCVDQGIVDDPTGPTGPLTLRVSRGGGWAYPAHYLRVAYRNFNT
ncbi:SUMF1/EgtB/PvdO family nonheme iron enzyme, partial [Thermodesulfobacteriota bacterium]